MGLLRCGENARRGKGLGISKGSRIREGSVLVGGVCGGVA